ncbi:MULTISPECIES: S1 family peptidase [Actinopolyspora]|uniref:Trypsin n=1 Tax=Actinopolyspora saharensis TaxID=995062 RepID=A0A1H1GXK0_9ACTN|nr:Trypsin [Actinopolyspora saharensis]
MQSITGSETESTVRKTATLLGGFAAAAMALAVVPAAGATPAPDEPNTMIVGGDQADESYEWMASLQQNGKHFCGASLIDEQWALTAAHCVQDVSADELQVRIGSSDHTTGGTVTGVDSAVPHPDYATESPQGDIALVKLDQSVEQQPVELAEQPGQAGTPTSIIGWGLTCRTRGCGQPPEQLQQLDTKLVSDLQCSLGTIDGATELCTSSDKPFSNACFGDSGGPQLRGEPGDRKLIGVTSRLGSPIPACGTAPSVYTDATAYGDWIRSHTQG